MSHELMKATVLTCIRHRGRCCTMSSPDAARPDAPEAPGQTRTVFCLQHRKYGRSGKSSDDAARRAVVISGRRMLTGHVGVVSEGRR